MSRNEQGRLALHHATHCGRPDMVRLLLDLGADVGAADLSGSTALAHARDGVVVQVLLDAGARPDLMSALTLGRYEEAAAMLAAEPARLGPNGQDTICLHLAIDRRNLPAMRWLVEHGADVDAKRVLYGCNQTPLHICAERGLVDTARELLAAGADTTIPDDTFHADALGWAEYCKQPKVADLIRARRAGTTTDRA
jgi:ankyrin repeat protein